MKSQYIKRQERKKVYSPQTTVWLSGIPLSSCSTTIGRSDSGTARRFTDSPAVNRLRLALALTSSLLPQARGQPHRMTTTSTSLSDRGTSLKSRRSSATLARCRAIRRKSTRGLQEPQYFRATLTWRRFFDTYVSRQAKAVPRFWPASRPASFCAQNWPAAQS